MTGEMERRPEPAPPVVPASGDTGWADRLVAWADAADKAHSIACILAETAFVPKSMQHQPGNVTGAILTGMELNVPIMWALANIDVVDGTPAIRAKALRALALRGGHEVWTEEATGTRVTVCGRRKGTSRVERSTWTMDRAKKAELVGKKNWRQYPQDMLLNRATAEVFRLIAPDELIVAHTVDEVGGDDDTPGGMPVAEEKEQQPAPAKRRTAQRTPAPAPGVDPQALPADIPGPGDRPPVVPVIGDAQAAQTMAGAGFETVDIIDGMDGPAGEVSDELPPAPMSDPQRKMMFAEMRRVGLVERDECLAYCAHVVGHPVASRSDLTKGEAARVITALTEKALDAVRARYGEPDPADPNAYQRQEVD